MPQLFQTLTTFSPRQFQHQTIVKILNRQNILLRAPTRSGKTETAIAPFLFAKALISIGFPNKLIYVVPLRTLAKSLRQWAEIRTFKAVSHPLNAPVILDDIQAHQRKRVIVICNTVSQPQGLFRDL